MATARFRIVSFYAFLNPKFLINSSLGNHEPIPAQALIQGLGANGESIAVYFLDRDRNVSNTDPDLWPNRANITGSKVVAELFAPISQYPWYLDILRNEDPVSAVIDSSQPFLCRIYCNEPVGEGDYL